MVKYSVCALGAVVLAGCTTIPQTTSGADYLAAYADPAYANSTASLDDEIREIAAIEPNLRFPARIGLARIERNQLVSVPVEEGLAWQDVGQELGANFGEFVPVSPLIAATVARPHTRNTDARQTVLANIRRGAARQHIDYVLIYEVTTKDERTPNVLSLGDATVLGYFVLPSREIDVEAASSALLMDVRNGYPYATITEYAEKDGLARGFRAGAKRDALKEAASLKAVEALAAEAGSVLRDLATSQTVVASLDKD